MDFDNQAPMDALCEKWEPLLEHDALPRIEDSYKKKVTVLRLLLVLVQLLRPPKLSSKKLTLSSQVTPVLFRRSTVSQHSVLPVV